MMFTLAVQGFGRDRLPYPFRYEPERRHPHEPVGYDEYQRLRTEARRRLRQMADERLHQALSVLLEPEVRVEVHGYYGPNFQQVVRMHAGTSRGSAALAIQLPGPTQEYGRDIILTRLPPEALPKQIVMHLPACAPGRYRPVRSRRSDVDKAEYSQHPTRLSPSEEVNRIIRRRRSGFGEVGVLAGPAIDARPTPDVRGFHWMDYLPEDGRYILHHLPDEEFVLTPGQPDEVARQLQRLIETTRRSPARRW